MVRTSFRQYDYESTHASFIHSLIFFPIFFSADTLASPPSGSGNGGVSTKTTRREPDSSNVHRTCAKSVVQGDNGGVLPSDVTSNSFAPAAVFIN